MGGSAEEAEKINDTFDRPVSGLAPDQKKIYPSIDIAKLVMAILVVLIHRPIVSGGLFRFLLSDHSMLSVAVPFFFIVSAFLFFRKLQQPDVQPKRALLQLEKRMLKLYFLYSAIYFPIDLIKTYAGEFSAMTLRTFAAFVVLYAKNTLFFISFTHLWYVYALIVCIPVVFLLTRIVRGKRTVAFIAAAEFFIIAALYALFPEAADKLPYMVVKILRVGFPCVCVGYFAAQCSDSVPRAQRAMLPVFWSLLLGTSLLSYTNQTAVWEYVRLLCAFLTAFALLRFCLSVPLKHRPVYPILRNYSTLIYFLHLLLSSEILSFIAAHTGMTALKTSNPLRFCLTLSLVWLEASCILLLQKKKAFRFLRYLY